MRLKAPKKTVLILCSIFSLCSLAILNSALVGAANNKPYFKVSGADILTGGGFDNGSTACQPDASYQAPDKLPPDTTNPEDYFKGAILAFSKASTPGALGASSQFAALSLGLIEGTDSGNKNYGFATGQPNTNKSALSFAGVSKTGYPPTFWGGFFEGADKKGTVLHQSHCVPDYYQTKQSKPKSIKGDLDNFSSLTELQYLLTPSGNFSNIRSGTVKAGQNLTIFVDGNVYITGNISYEGRSKYDANNPPKFAMVAKGNIFIGKDVTQLDGFYIAQPGGGELSTCRDASRDPYTGIEVNQNCRQPLVINGALASKKINLLRVRGDVDDNDNVAEQFHYTPEMVVGGPFFGQGSSNGKIESLVSLPPVF